MITKIRVFEHVVESYIWIESAEPFFFFFFHIGVNNRQHFYLTQNHFLIFEFESKQKKGEQPNDKKSEHKR